MKTDLSLTFNTDYLTTKFVVSVNSLLATVGIKSCIGLNSQLLIGSIDFVLISLFVLLLQTYFLPVIGLVEPENLTPGDLVVRTAY